MNAIKEGLMDLASSYKEDIAQLKTEVDGLKEHKQQQNIQQDMNSIGL